MPINVEISFFMWLLAMKTTRTKGERLARIDFVHMQVNVFTTLRKIESYVQKETKSFSCLGWCLGSSARP